MEALAVDTGAHHNRNDIALADVGLYGSIDLILGKFLAGEVALHIFLAGLGNSLDQGIADDP